MNSRCTLSHLAFEDRYHLTVDGKHNGWLPLEEVLTKIAAQKKVDRPTGFWCSNNDHVLCIGYLDDEDRWISPPKAVGTWEEMWVVFESYARMI
jgi:hypothetical protein